MNIIIDNNLSKFDGLLAKGAFRFLEKLIETSFANGVMVVAHYHWFIFDSVVSAEANAADVDAFLELLINLVHHRLYDNR